MAKFNGFTDNGALIEFEGKIPLEDCVIYGAIAHEIDRFKLNGIAGTDKELCSLAYGKVIWQKFMFPLLKEIGYEMGADTEDITEDIFNWFKHCME